MPDVSKVIYDTSGEIIDGPVYSVNGERREVNKVVYGVTTLIDITDSTVTSNNLLRGNVAYSADGSRVVGNIDQTIEHLEVGGTVSLDENDYMEFDDSGSGGGGSIEIIDLSENLHDSSEDVPNTYINGSTQSSYNGWTSTGYIPVKPNTYYRVTNTPGNNYNAFYKSDKTAAKSSLVIPSVSNSDGYTLIKTTSTTAYIRMSGASSGVSRYGIYEVNVVAPNTI